MPRRRLLERAMIHHTRDIGPETRLLWLLMHLDADDFGRLFASAKHLCGDLFPFDAEVTADDVEVMLTALESQHLIKRYTDDGSEYAQLLHWNQPGPIGRSRIPPPEGEPALPAPLRRGRPFGSHKTVEDPEVADIKERATALAPIAEALGDAEPWSVEMVLVPLAPDITPAKVTRSRKRDEIIDELAFVEGVVDLASVTKPAWSRLAKAKAIIIEVCPGVTVDEIRVRAKRLKAKWPNADVTATSLASHWGQLEEEAKPMFDDRIFAEWMEDDVIDAEVIDVEVIDNDEW